MSGARRFLLLAAVVAAALAPAAPAFAQDVHSDNMTLLHNIPKVDTQTQSDLAFQGDIAYAGTYSGIRVIDVSDPANATQISFLPCIGSQGDVSVYGDLLVASTYTPQDRPTCDSQNTSASNPDAWEGVRIFDISDPEDVRLIKSVRTDCGSHTNTLVPAGKGSVFVYVSSYGLTTTSMGPHCEQFHGKISVVHIPVKNPQKAEVVATPAIDMPVYESDRLGIPSPALQDTTGCHDITVMRPLKLAAAACLSEGQLWDISDITNPRKVHSLMTEQFGAWHSAQFSWDGRRVVFGDEAGGGSLNRCRAGDFPEIGAVWIYDVASGAELGHYKLPRTFADEFTGSCTMHNFNFVPGVERDILVSAAYTGGTTVADLTDPANPVEIGYYRAAEPIAANTWSTYWHNGFIYANDIARGFDVFSIDHPSVEGAAELFRDNPQTQERLFP